MLRAIVSSSLLTFLNPSFFYLWTYLFYALCLILLISEIFAGLIWYFCWVLHMVLCFLIYIMSYLFVYVVVSWIYIPWNLITRKSSGPMEKGISISSCTKDLKPWNSAFLWYRLVALGKPDILIFCPLPHPANLLKPKLQVIWVWEMSFGQKPTSILLFSFLGSYFHLDFGLWGFLIVLPNHQFI